jgi:hypothetical protein
MAKPIFERPCVKLLLGYVLDDSICIYLLPVLVVKYHAVSSPLALRTAPPVVVHGLSPSSKEGLTTAWVGVMLHVVVAGEVLAVEDFEATFDAAGEDAALPDADGITELCTAALLDEAAGEDEVSHVPRDGWQPEPQWLADDPQ